MRKSVNEVCGVSLSVTELSQSLWEATERVCQSVKPQERVSKAGKLHREQVSQGSHRESMSVSEATERLIQSWKPRREYVSQGSHRKINSNMEATERVSQSGKPQERVSYLGKPKRE